MRFSLYAVLMAVTFGNLAGVFADDAWFYSGGRQWPLRASQTHVAIETTGPLDGESLRQMLPSRSALVNWNAIRWYAKDTVAVLPLAVPSSANVKQLAESLAGVKAVRRVLKVYGPDALPIVATSDFVVQFRRRLSLSELQRFCDKYASEVVRPLGEYAPHGYLCRMRASNPSSVLEIANRIYERESVHFSHPDFIWPKAPRFVPNDPKYPNQWHLNNTGQAGGTPDADVDAPEAWDIAKGAGVTFAIIDQGVDLDHEDFQATGKILPGYDFKDNDSDPRPGTGESHGTAVAGVASAVVNNAVGVTGIAPGTRLMAIRMGSTNSSEAACFNYAATHGADVINCSWGPIDGLGIPQPLPDVVRTAIDYAADVGRGGKGCVIFWAAGNGNESADLDGYCSYSKVICVAACNDDNLRSAYSDFGTSVDVCAPSNDTASGHAAITTTDRMGSAGYSLGNYTSTFGGTSSASPLACGVGALVLSVNPGLTRLQVQEILQNTAEKIDTARGAYTNGHSRYYGYGKVNAYLAVQSAGSGVFPTVTSITPNSGYDNAVVNITDLAGANFAAGAQVKLSKTGQTDIVAVPGTVTVVSPTKITCSFDLNRKAPGQWNVVVTNPDGRSGMLPNGFTIISTAIYQPDMQIRNSSVTTYTGDNIYNTTGANQTSQQTVAKGVNAKYILKLQNDGTASDSFVVKGTKAPTGWVVKYFNAKTGGKDVTAAVTSAGGGTSPVLAAGAAPEFRVEVTPGSSLSAGVSLEVCITATSKTDATKKDTVKAVTTVAAAAAPSGVVLNQLTASPNPATRGAMVEFGYTVENQTDETVTQLILRFMCNGKVLGKPRMIHALGVGEKTSGTIRLCIPADTPSGEYLVTGELWLPTRSRETAEDRQTVRLAVQ